MAKTLPNSLQETIQSVRKAKKDLARLCKDMPDHDAYAYAYSVAKYAQDALENCLKELGPETRQAIRAAKKQPDAGSNRAIQWA